MQKILLLIAFPLMAYVPPEFVFFCDIDDCGYVTLYANPPMCYAQFGRDSWRHPTGVLDSCNKLVSRLKAGQETFTVQRRNDDTMFNGETDIPFCAQATFLKIGSLVLSPGRDQEWTAISKDPCTAAEKQAVIEYPGRAAR